MRDFYRVGLVSPRVVVGNPQANAQAILEAYRAAVAGGAHIVLTPELSLTGYSCGDLFGNAALLRETESALDWLLEEMVGVSLEVVLVVGLPVLVGTRLFNCAAVLHAGAIHGLVPKETLANYKEFYEKRNFRSGSEGKMQSVIYCGQEVAFGADLLFDVNNDFRFGIELCEDAWALTPPAVGLVKGGAHVILNLSASPEMIGKAAARRELVVGQSSRLACLYAYAGAGIGESTTDLVFGGHLLAACYGKLLAENQRFERKAEPLYADFNPVWIDTLRRQETSFNEAPFDDHYRIVELAEMLHEVDGQFAGLSATPFVPADIAHKQERCAEILEIQLAGLAKRFEHTKSRRLVVGLSGGLDSTLALLVCTRMCERLGLPPTTVLGITMPGFGTGERTRGNVDRLAEALGIELRCIPIAKSVEQHFADIGHDPKDLSTVYENAQARERTQILMDIANGCGGLVVGTGDLSEIALGWSTFNGDHMAMYSVNCGVPKTLVRHIIEVVAQNAAPTLAETLRDIIATPVSPELLPGGTQETEQILGPYELHDFCLYYFIKYALGREELLELANAFWSTHYSEAIITDTINRFLQRFIGQQFKRSALPDGPKVGTIALSPRGDWRMPSDAACSL